MPNFKLIITGSLSGTVVIKSYADAIAKFKERFCIAHQLDATQFATLKDSIEYAFTKGICFEVIEENEFVADYLRTLQIDKPFIVNGYSIRFNPMWNAWQVNHTVSDEVPTNEFDTLLESIDYAKKG